MITQIINNTALLVCLSLFYGLLYTYFRQKTLINHLVHGVLFGSMSVIVMLTPINFSPGIIFDTRSIVLCLAGLYGGPITAAVAVVIATIYRVGVVGGVGSFPAFVMQVSTAGLGVAFFYWLKLKHRDENILDLILLGIGAHILMCLAMLLLPWPMALKVVQKMAPPVMAVLPLATVLTALIVSSQRNRIRAEHKLRESEAKYRSMMEALTDPTCSYTPDFKIEYMNPAMERLVGRNAEGDFCYQALHNLDQPCEQCIMDEVLSGKKLTRECQLGISDRHFLSAHFPINHADGSISKMTIFRDITELKSAEQAMFDSEARFRALFEEAGDAIFVCDTEGRLEEVNIRACESLGYSRQELLKLNLNDMDVLHSDPVKLTSIFDPAQEGQTILLERTHRRKDGSTFPVEVRLGGFRLGGQTRIMGIARDISKRKQGELEKQQLEARLAQAQKMEAIGTLAGGIAHDFNNILGSIIGYTELAQIDIVDDPGRVGNYLDQILAGGMRAKNLVQQILTFSRQSKHEKRTIELKPILKEVLKLLHSSLPATIEIRSDISVSDGYVLADPTSMHQVLMNLCTNAADAMDETGGVLDVSLSEALLGNDDLVGGLPAAPGRYQLITVSDTGHGIPADVQKKIFEPFFTTKDLGQGTGLGLSTVHGIVKDHGGSIAVYSEPDKGTTFNLFFPLIDESTQSAEQAAAPALQGGDERILFVDDEDALVDIGNRILSGLGYRVTPTNSSIEALEMLRADPGGYDLLITDMTMPHMTGLDLAADAHDIRPDLPILLLTGFSKQLSMDKASRYGVRKLISKPVLRNQIAADIREVLDKSQARD